jgi:predicted DNA-binding ribbon-helix-helix protein
MRDAGQRVVQHSLSIAGHRTSISLEEAFWRALKEIAARRQIPLAQLVTDIDAGRGDANLSSAIRVLVLEDAQARQYRPAAEGSIAPGTTSAGGGAIG